MLANPNDENILGNNLIPRLIVVEYTNTQFEKHLSYAGNTLTYSTKNETTILTTSATPCHYTQQHTPCQDCKYIT